MAKLRSDVFFLEQRITEEELDDHDRDAQTMHYWISDRRGFVAYLRVVVDDDAAAEHRGVPHSIGRVVVRPDRRGEGLAKNLMQQAIDDYGHLHLALHAQTYVADLYRQFGFEPYGEPFEEAGIPHLTMLRPPAGA